MTDHAPIVKDASPWVTGVVDEAAYDGFRWCHGCTGGEGPDGMHLKPYTGGSTVVLACETCRKFPSDVTAAWRLLERHKDLTDGRGRLTIGWPKWSDRPRTILTVWYGSLVAYEASQRKGAV